MKHKIEAALTGLDPRNAEHWTAEGLPSLKALGIEGIKRADVTAAAPHFTRDNPVLTTPDEEAKEQAKISAAEAAEAAKAELGTIEEQKAALQLNIDRKTHALNVAKQELQEAIGALDEILQREFQAGAARKPIHDIMDFVESQRKRREAAAEARKGG